MRLARLLITCALLAAAATPVTAGQPLAVGSKKFTESVILGEMLAHAGREAGFAVRHRRELGGTRVLFDALRQGDIHAYPEYTGTLRFEVLAAEGLADDTALAASLARQGLAMSAPLGFNNTYALAMRPEQASRLGIRRISDLAAHGDLVLGFSNEFMDRGDGWPGLRDRYRLPQAARGLDHDLAYRALEAGDLDVLDVYATDAEIAYYGLTVLEDDLGYFPEYQAVVLHRADLPVAVLRSFASLSGRLDAAAMSRLNARVKLEGESESAVAAGFLRATFGWESRAQKTGMWQRLAIHGGEHLLLVVLSLAAAITFSIPLGILAARRRGAGQLILGITGILQTIPSLALLVVMIPLLGIGAAPAVAALFLYSLLPIVRNTATGLSGIDPEVLESARAMGLPGATRLWRIELPLATATILAGIKTAAVINIGTATLAALVGAGGFGQPILTGIRLNDTGLILEGAVPAAALAITAQALFEWAERHLLPRGLRTTSGTSP